MLRATRALPTLAAALACAGALAGLGQGQALARTPSGSGVSDLSVTCVVDVTYYPLGSPQGFGREVRTVLQEASALTGVQFRLRTSLQSKPTTAVPRQRTWITHVAIAWDEPDRQPAAGLRSKLGVALMTMTAGKVEGATILLNAERLRPSSYELGGERMTARPMVVPGQEVLGKPPVGTANLLRHELGHVLGLDHVSDFESIMTPFLTRYRGVPGYSADTRILLRQKYSSCKT